MELNGPAFPVRKRLHVIAFLGDFQWFSSDIPLKSVVFHLSQWYSSCIPLKSPNFPGISNDFPNKTHHPLVAIVLTSLCGHSQDFTARHIAFLHHQTHPPTSTGHGVFSENINGFLGFEKGLNGKPLDMTIWVFHKWPLGSPFSQIIAHWKWILGHWAWPMGTSCSKPWYAVWKTVWRKHDEPWFRKKWWKPWTDETMGPWGFCVDDWMTPTFWRWSDGQLVSWSTLVDHPRWNYDELWSVLKGHV